MNLVRTIQIRITNIYQNASNYIAISGVPLSEKAYNQNGHKKIIYIKSKTDVVPISPEIGQQWLVSGLEDRRTNSHNGFNVDERHYINPISLVCILQEDCDSFIHFINEEEGFVV
ncbi:MAG: hypothetical protein CMH98_04620 [Oceanospirillaceae bacterium]|nr:hypothetical protein [Oceanospirillaceae bacterium]